MASHAEPRSRWRRQPSRGRERDEHASAQQHRRSLRLLCCGTVASIGNGAPNAPWRCECGWRMARPALNLNVLNVAPPPSRREATSTPTTHTSKPLRLHLYLQPANYQSQY
eukprot:scaffold87210_cov35-Tisochrysis_lutea.AAC.2